MIDELVTFNTFGYYSEDLTPHSNKYVVVTCPTCGQNRILKKQKAMRAAQCKLCNYKHSAIKNKSVIILKYYPAPAD